jgi:SAM-dependent methyltransferase
MAGIVSYFPNQQIAERAAAGMRAYAQTRQELDKLLQHLLPPLGDATILDAACGIGHLSEVLLEDNPDATYLGVDETPAVIREARDLWSRRGVRFEVADVNTLPDRYPNGFDIVVSWKTLTWLEHYDRMLPALMALSRKHLFVSSLFYDGDIDFQTRVQDHGNNAEWFYNVYSLPRFVARLRDLGAQHVEVNDFEIGIDLPRGDPDVMGTYTRRLEDGRRLQFSGALWMPWKVLRVDISA